MAIETKTVIRYDYKCKKCSHNYIEQRSPSENAYFTNCNVAECDGEYELVTQTESTYEQEILDVVTEEQIEEPIE